MALRHALVHSDEHMFEHVQDASEEVMLLCMLQNAASRSNHAVSALGMLSPNATGPLEIDLNLSSPLDSGKRRRLIASVTATIEQNLARLKSSQRTSDTSGAVWRLSLSLAKELLLPHFFPRLHSFLDGEALKKAKVLELGSGCGLLPCLASRVVGRWTATDMPDCLGVLRRNVAANRCTNIDVLAVDWHEPPLLRDEFDLILGVDVVYHEALALPVVQTMTQYASAGTLALLAVEVRSAEMVEHFLSTWMAGGWDVWRVDSAAFLEAEMRDPGYNGMDCLKAVQFYVDRIIQSTPGIKVLLLDSETTPIVSLATTTSHLLEHEVYLTDRLDNTTREELRYLKCLVFVRPSSESLAALEHELQNPKYGQYWLYFTHILKKSAIERLAEMDDGEVVQELQEFYADYCPVTTSHVSLNILPSPLSSESQSIRNRLYGELPNVFDLSPLSGSFSRHAQGLSALLLSLKKKPVIRYERNSPMARKLSQEVQNQINEEAQLFDFRPAAVPPILLILDRRNDPVTPLLSQWTYQAMVHELIGITNGRVSLAGAPDITDDLKEIVLTPEQDPFFAKTLYDNFGDLGAHVKDYVSDYQSKSSSGRRKIDTVADMKRFVEEYPEFRKLGGNVSKHVALVGELSRLVEQRKLLEVSELEQSLATVESHASDLKSLHDMITSEQIFPENKLRLAMLYALRYQKFGGNQINQIVKLLPSHGVSESDASLVHIMLNFAGADQRQGDLFANENFFSRGKSALKGLKGVDNVYTQHSPQLLHTLDQLIRGKLKDSTHPYLENQPQAPQMQATPVKPQDIIVFIIGGTTYEEARTVALLNGQGGTMSSAGPASSQVNPRIVLAGTGVLSSETFLSMLRDAASRFPATMTSSALSLKPATANPPVNLKVGGLEVTLTGVGRTPSQLESGVKDAARGLISTIRQGVERL